MHESFESKVVASFLRNRKDYDNAYPHLNHEEWSPLGAVILDTINSYYAKDLHAEAVDLEVFRMSLDRRFKDVPRHMDKARDYLEGVVNLDVSSINVISEIIEQKRAQVGTQLADALISQDHERIGLYLREYEELADSAVLEDHVQDEYVGVTLDQLEEQFNDDGSWKLAPGELSKRIRGGLRPGHAVVVAARPERGKTLFGINFAAGFLVQGARVLYIGNEDPVPDLVLRMLSNLTGRTEQEMFADKDGTMEIALERGYDRCVFVGLSPGTLYEVEALVRRHEPDILIVDQMRNIRAKTENRTQQLEVVAQELRNIGRKHGCVVISMTQVGDSGRDKLVLNDGDIDGSNTGIPGACDVIVMIGSNEDFERRDLRRLTLAKNKRGGDHSDFTVSVDRARSRVTSWNG